MGPNVILQMSEQHQSTTPLSNTSCGYKELTYCTAWFYLTHQNLNAYIFSPQKDKSQKKCKACMAAPVAATAPEVIVHRHGVKISIPKVEKMKIKTKKVV